MMRVYFFIVVFMGLSLGTVYSQETSIPLWADSIPNQRKTDAKEIRTTTDIVRIENVQEPTLEVYLPAKRNATQKAVVICPGGGYRRLAYDWEGTDIAKWFNAKGIAAFVLKYRLPISKSLINGTKAPLQDAQRALRLVRHHAATWNIATDQVGIMGFSAGGHLASTLGTHYDHDKKSARTAIDSLSARPDFMILVYPVITMKDASTHAGSKKNLLGGNPSQKMVDFYSNELHVDDQTPPTFLVHATDDTVVSVTNSLLLYQALEKKKVYVEMHIYPKGGHGFGLAVGQGHLETWTDRLSEWLESLE